MPRKIMLGFIIFMIAAIIIYGLVHLGEFNELFFGSGSTPGSIMLG